MSYKLIEWTIEFKTWTSDTMIPDSRTVPQAVHTESALKIRRLIPWWTWSSCNIHQRVTYVSELDLNRKKNFGKPKQNEQNLRTNNYSITKQFHNSIKISETLYCPIQFQSTHNSDISSPTLLVAEPFSLKRCKSKVLAKAQFKTKLVGLLVNKVQT